jgi:hypothetical protein
VQCYRHYRRAVVVDKKESEHGHDCYRQPLHHLECKSVVASSVIIFTLSRFALTSKALNNGSNDLDGTIATSGAGHLYFLFFNHHILVLSHTC